MRDAIRSPRTVVVHLWYASMDMLATAYVEAKEKQPLAGLAVVSSRWLISLASTAPPPRSRLIHFLFRNTGIRLFPIWREPTGVYKACPEIAYPNAECKYVDLPEFITSKWRRFEVLKEVLGCVCQESNQNTDSWNRQLSDRKVITEHVDLQPSTLKAGRSRHDRCVVYRLMTNPHDMGESI